MIGDWYQSFTFDKLDSGTKDHVLRKFTMPHDEWFRWRVVFLESEANPDSVAVDRSLKANARVVTTAIITRAIASTPPISVGTAVKCPADTNDPMIGRRIAFARALDQHFERKPPPDDEEATA